MEFTFLSCKFGTAEADPAPAPAPAVVAAPTAAPQAQQAGPKARTPRRIVLVSDNLHRYETLVQACLPHCTVIVVRYDQWSLDDLKKAITDACEEPKQQYMSVGLMDHGAAGEFCLLKKVAGGSIDMGDFEGGKGKEVIAFFKWLAQYVTKPKTPGRNRANKQGTLDLFACSVAANEEGLKLIKFLEKTTGLNVAASTDKTGAGDGAEGGFDYVLETEGADDNTFESYFNPEILKKWTNTMFFDLLFQTGDYTCH